MASVEDIKQELAKAEAEKQKAENEVTAWKGRYGQRLTDLENKLWGNEGTATDRAKWEKEKTQLEKRQEVLEADKRERLKQVEEWGAKLREMTSASQPGNDFVTRALGT